MNSPGSVTDYLRQLQAGDRAAAQKLWERYFQRLVDLARRKLLAVPRRAVDEEDVALDAFDSFCRAVEAGRYPDLQDRNGLWQVLLSLTINKAIDVIHHAEREKRSWRRTVLLSEMAAAEPGSSVVAFADMLRSGEPDPAFAVALADRVEWLLGRLEDEQLRRIALLKLEGHANPEIARRLGCALSTVERRLRLIRRRLESHLPAGDGAGPA
jgi:DNA-directed RNA polymerase specialized sigma24 family protein